MDAALKLEEDGHEVGITGVYREPDSKKRHITWNLLIQLHAMDQRPWFIGGDYNEILNTNEKE